MNFRVTNVAQAKRTIWGGGQIRAVNVTEGECAATLTTRYDAVGPTNITTLAHYPMTVVLIEYEM